MIDREKPALNIRHEVEKQQFVLPVRHAGDAVLKYQIRQRTEVEVMDFTHTFVPEAVRNQGIGHAIVKYGVQYARKKGFQVRGTCPFVKSYLDEHPEYEAIRNRGETRN